MAYKTRLNIASTSVIGNHRSHNEDNFFINGTYMAKDFVRLPSVFETFKSKQHIVAVFDGMGGEKKGDEASLLAAKSYQQLYDEICKKSLTDEALNLLMNSFTFDLNSKICLEAEKLNVGRIGTTMATLIIKDGVAHIYNLGDSRVYLYRRKMLNRITNDHNEAAMLIKLGMLTPENARNHPSKYRLTQHLGVKDEEANLQAEKYPPIKLLKGDIFLLCSDGLVDDISESEIAQYFNTNDDIEGVINEMVNDALQRDAKDNITVIGVQVKKITTLLGISI